MTYTSNFIVSLGLLFLTHACYSAHEYAAINSISPSSIPKIPGHGATTSILSSLPTDIAIETIVALLLICLGLVLRTPELRPIQWRVWGGIVQKDGGKTFTGKDGLIQKGYVNNPFEAMESRPVFVDIRKQRKEFSQWMKENKGDASDKKSYISKA